MFLILFECQVYYFNENAATVGNHTYIYPWASAEKKAHSSNQMYSCVVVLVVEAFKRKHKEKGQKWSL